ncbi:uncharacterized protein [Arachis hypogaea]|uniref:uncharacterized protein n=1 Tax=Arachis hypogaea TaxID=3818 RepID=UPI003B20F431
MQQRRWMKLQKDYDFELNYHPEKANVVADALSRKSLYAAWMMLREKELLKAFESLKISVQEESGTLFIEQGKQWRVSEDQDGLWRFKDRIIVPDVGALRQDFLKEVHKSGFSIHPGSTKMYNDLKVMFWWPETFWDITTFGDSVMEVGEHCDGFCIRKADFDAVWRSPFHFEVLGCISESFQNPFELEYGLPSSNRWVGPVAYRMALRPHLSNLHDVFYMSQLQKYTPDTSHVLEPELVQLKEDLTLPVTPVRIDDTSIKKLCGKEVSLVKVAWIRAGVQGHTRELESEMRADYPHLFLGN